MSPTPILSPAVRDTVLAHLIPHFITITGGDRPAALQAASDMLASYQAETEAELHLAAEIVSFGLHALDALGQAASPDLPLNKILRFRGSAVSLSRESHKAQRKLDQLQHMRRTKPLPDQPPAAIQPPDKPEAAEAQGIAAQARPALPPSDKQALPSRQVVGQQRHNGQRANESLNDDKAKYARREAGSPKVHGQRSPAESIGYQPDVLRQMSLGGPEKHRPAEPSVSSRSPAASGPR